jgi:thioredoxin 1
VKPGAKEDDPVSQFVTDVSDQSFEAEVLQSGTPVLVDFWAAWCGPCRVLAPAVDEVAVAFGGRLKVVKVNVDDNMATMNRLNIRSIPTLVLFKDGVEQDRMVGLQQQDSVTRMIERHVV